MSQWIYQVSLRPNTWYNSGAASQRDWTLDV